MTSYRATRNEPRVGVGNWTGDFHRGEIYESVEINEEGVYPRSPNQVPDYICDYLVSHGVLVDARITEHPAETPLPPSPQRPVKIIPIAEMAEVNNE